jgi:H+/Cl- antiporter ClcA
MIKLRLTEHTVLFFSIVKWVIFASIAGIVAGSATALFLKALGAGTSLASSYPYWFLLIPAGLFASALLVKHLAPDAQGHGTEKVIEAVHLRSGKIPVAVVPVKLAATVITLSCGGSAGKEGPCAQIGAGLTSFMSDLFRFNEHDRKKMVICGISAGFAAVFGTPVAGAIFGVEVLFIGAILYDVLLPSFVAGITAYHTASFLGISYARIPVTPVAFSEGMMLKVMAAGVFFGICSVIFILFLKLSGKLSGKLAIPSPLKALAGGCVLAALAIIFSRNYLGLGTETMQSYLKGEDPGLFGFLLKPLFTGVTLSSGGSGGVITPIFFTGAAAGNFFAHITGSDRALFAAIGLTAVLAGAANTPIAASIMSIEMFGPEIAPYAAVACVISFLMTGHRSVYPSQILSMSKSSSLIAEEGKSISRADTKIRKRTLKSALPERIFGKKKS